MLATSFYAALLALLFVVLTARVILMRRSAKIALGDQGNPDMLRRMRVQANFVETVPLALLLLLIAELQALPQMLLHITGIMLVAGRLMHAYGVSQKREIFNLRVGGMVLTLACILILAASLLIWPLIF